MNSFIYENPTKIVFGEDAVIQLKDEINRWGKRVLFLYGSGSIYQNGVYDAVNKQLKKCNAEVIEYGGVVGNPRLSHARKGIEIVKEKSIDLILAVGGGSVIDEAKAIAAGCYYNGDVWDLYQRKGTVSEALPIISVLTLPATASEMNGFSVLTNEETNEKCAMGASPIVNPRVSFLNPAFTTSLSLDQTAYAAADIISHATEGYFTTSAEELFPVDELVEGTVRSVVDSVAKIRRDPGDIEARSALMWSATLAWNGTMQMGIPGMGLPCHALEMPLSGIYDIAHGAGLAIVTPAWMRHVENMHGERIIRFGKRCLGVEGSVAEIASAMEELYRRIGAPLKLSELGIENIDVDLLTRDAHNAFKQRNVSGYDESLIASIYRSVL